MPGQRHYSKRLEKQKKILKEPVASLFKRFRNQNPGIKVSKGTFFRCRPRHIVSMKSQHFVECLCELCENAKLKLNLLKMCGTEVLCLDIALDQTLCPKSNGWWMPHCVSRECNSCGIHKDKLRIRCDVNTAVAYEE